MMRHKLIACGLIALSCATACAHERDGVWTYEWYVPYSLEHEVEFWWTDFGGGQSDLQLESEYGVDGHYAASVYALAERDGGDYRVNGWKVEQRYAFGEFAFNRVLPAAYLEVKRSAGEPYELEGKWINTYALPSGLSFSANLVGEQELESGNAFEWGYEAMVSHSLPSGASVAIESFGNLFDSEFFVGPTVGKTLDVGRRLLAGYAFNTKGGPGRLRFLFEIEF